MSLLSALRVALGALLAVMLPLLPWIRRSGVGVGA